METSMDEQPKKSLGEVFQREAEELSPEEQALIEAKMQRSRRIQGVLGTLAVVIALAVGAWFLFRPAAKTTTTEVATVSNLSYTPSSTSTDQELATLAQTAQVHLDDRTTQQQSWYQWSPQAGATVIEATAAKDNSITVSASEATAPDSAGHVGTASNTITWSKAATVPVPTAVTGSVTEALQEAAGSECALGTAACTLLGITQVDTTFAPKIQLSDAQIWTALREVPDVTLLGTTTDRTGKPAVALGAKITGADSQLVVLVNPETGHFSGAEWDGGKNTNQLIAVTS
jgi:hypothetical protein